MNLQLINPMFTTPQVSFDISMLGAKQEQLIRIIEKTLLAESIICEEIKIVGG